MLIYNTMTNSPFLRIGALLGALAVGIGAFGAHGLKPHLSEYQITIFEKGVQYQFYHVLALLAVGLLLRQAPDNQWLRRAGWLFIAGLSLFQGRCTCWLAAICWHSRSAGRDLLHRSAGFAFLAAWGMFAVASNTSHK